MAEEKTIKRQDIVFTDIQIHTVKPTNPVPWYRAIIKSLRSGRPGRIYSKDFSITDVKKENGSVTVNFRIPMPEGLKEKITEIEKTGRKIRLLLPKNGVPVYVGKDVTEFINARNNRFAKRILQKHTTK